MLLSASVAAAVCCQLSHGAHTAGYMQAWLIYSLADACLCHSSLVSRFRVPKGNSLGLVFYPHGVLSLLILKVAALAGLGLVGCSARDVVDEMRKLLGRCLPAQPAQSSMSVVLGPIIWEQRW